MTLTIEEIEHLKHNKQLITQDLLDVLRCQGNKGKRNCLDILDLCTDEEQFYLDSFNNRISFLGNRRLKKAFTKLNISKIHEIEFERCAVDLHYFMNNYINIRTQTGINFPDLREYQTKLLDTFLPDDNDSIVGLLPRQSGKSIATAIYLVWMYIFHEDLNIGIVANKGSMAREFLANVKNILMDLPIWIQQGTLVWNKGSIENESKMRILTDVPGSDSFRGFTISLLVCDETAFIKPTIWTEFTDSIFPSQSGLAWKKNIMLSTANGMNHFYDIVQGARQETNGYVINEVNWRDVPRYAPDGSKLDPDTFRTKVINKHGVVHFNQNYANAFVGSSYTLIKAECLQQMQTDLASSATAVQELRDGKLRVYEYPEEGHKYVMTIDASKDGKDAFAVQVVDITDYRFVQVASANLQVDYLQMPEFIDEWCEWYNHPYLVIENNEGGGQSVADVMYKTYEYTNLHFDTSNTASTTNLTKARKKYPGFRTTKKTRRQILQTLKMFAENNKLVVNCSATIQELLRFILIKDKYQADDGAHDDLVMSLALVFVPFCNAKNFNDMKALVKNMYNADDLEFKERTTMVDLMAVGCFDDGVDDDSHTVQIEYSTIEEALEHQQGFV